MLSLYKSAFYATGRRLFGLSAKPSDLSYWEQLTGQSTKKNFSIFRNPIAGTKDAMKWLVLKIFAVIVIFKIAIANAQHIFAPRTQPIGQ
jgi:hypothetical protein